MKEISSAYTHTNLFQMQVLRTPTKTCTSSNRITSNTRGCYIVSPWHSNIYVRAWTSNIVQSPSSTRGTSYRPTCLYLTANKSCNSVDLTNWVRYFISWCTKNGSAWKTLPTINSWRSIASIDVFDVFTVWFSHYCQRTNKKNNFE